MRAKFHPLKEIFKISRAKQILRKETFLLRIDADVYFIKKAS